MFYKKQKNMSKINVDELIKSLINNCSGYFGVHEIYEALYDQGLTFENNEFISINTVNNCDKEKSIQPKFKVGDWIVDNDGIYLYQVQAVRDTEYWLNDTTNLPLTAQDGWHVWTINDIKKGDFLSYISDRGEKWLIIFKVNHEEYEGQVHYYALITEKEIFVNGTCFIDSENLKPASYVERDIIYRKLVENNFSWDNEAKSLTKINNVENDKTYVSIDDVCDYLSNWNQNQVKKFGSKAILGCSDFTISIYDFRKEMTNKNKKQY